MFRLLFGRGMDTLRLARHARTSPDGIDRFHAATLQGKMRVGVWLSTCDGVGEGSGVNGNPTFKAQTIEQLGKAKMYLAHQRTRVNRKQPVCAKWLSRQSLCH